jgi:hypothetical protein
MTSKYAARPQASGEANPKIDPAPNSNTEKEPSDWVSGNDPVSLTQNSLAGMRRARQFSTGPHQD